MEYYSLLERPQETAALIARFWYLGCLAGASVPRRRASGTDSIQRSGQRPRPGLSRIVNPVTGVASAKAGQQLKS